MTIKQLYWAMNNNKYIKTFKLLIPYLWPEKRKDLKTRVSFAVVALVLWGWHHFSIKWSYGLSSTKKDLEKSNDGLEEQKRSLFFELVSKTRFLGPKLGI